MNEQIIANFKKKLSIELETTTNDEAQLISNIVDSASAGSLPAVSADDNGKVLTVANGAWVAGNASGGGGILPIGLTITETAATFNRTWQEVYNAIANGVLPVILTNFEDSGQASVAFVIYAAGNDRDGYNVNVYMPNEDEPVQSFSCTSANDYPYQILK